MDMYARDIIFKEKENRGKEDISNELELDLDELKNIMSGINVGV